MIHWVEAHAVVIAGLIIVGFMIGWVVEACRVARAGRDDG
jgi:hypothetical protein